MVDERLEPRVFILETKGISYGEITDQSVFLHIYRTPENLVHVVANVGPNSFEAIANAVAQLNVQGVEGEIETTIPVCELMQMLVEAEAAMLDQEQES